MNKVVWALVVLLSILHYDFWYWDDASLVFGFMPIGLFYQALISLAAGIVWAMAVKWSWPSHIEEWADQEDVADAGGGEGAQ